MTTLAASIPFQIVSGAFFASSVSAAWYSVYRLVETHCHPNSGLKILLLMLSSFIFFIFAFGAVAVIMIDPHTSPAFLLLAGVWALGALCHLKSGGASRNVWGAYTVIAESSMASLVSGLLMGNRLFDAWILTDNWLATSYLLGLAIYPSLAPLAVWIWRSSRVRPGFDEAFEEGAG